jgi:hypothetical protein
MKKKIAFRNLCHFIPVRIFSDSSGKTVVLKGELTQRLIGMFSFAHVDDRPYTYGA